MATGVEYLIKFSMSVAAIDPIELSTSIYEQMVAEGWENIDFNAVRAASQLTYSAILSGASLDADFT